MKGDVRKLPIHVQKVLPLVYDDALSYYETLAKVVSKLNECIAYVDDVWDDIIKESIHHSNNMVEQAERDLLHELKTMEAEHDAKCDSEHDRLQAAFEAGIGTLNGKLDAERTEREFADTGLSERLDQLQDADEAAKEYVKQALDALENKLKAQIANLAKNAQEADFKLQSKHEADIDTLEGKWQELKAALEKKTAELQVGYLEFLARAEASQKANNALIKQILIECMHDLLAYVEQLAQEHDLSVYSPVSGKNLSVTEAFQELYETFLTVHSISAGEFDKLELPAQVLDEFDPLLVVNHRLYFHDSQYTGDGVQAFDFDWRARDVFFKWIYCRMYNPMTGHMAFYDEIIMMLIWFHLSKLTAEQYDALDLDNNEFEALALTAHRYEYGRWYAVLPEYKVFDKVHAEIYDDIEELGQEQLDMKGKMAGDWLDTKNAQEKASKALTKAESNKEELDSYIRSNNEAVKGADDKATQANKAAADADTKAQAAQDAITQAQATIEQLQSQLASALERITQLEGAQA